MWYDAYKPNEQWRKMKGAHRSSWSMENSNQYTKKVKKKKTERFSMVFVHCSYSSWISRSFLFVMTLKAKNNITCIANSSFKIWIAALNRLVEMLGFSYENCLKDNVIKFDKCKKLIHNYCWSWLKSAHILELIHHVPS